MRRTLLGLSVLLLAGSTFSGTPHLQQDLTLENVRAFARLYGWVRWFHPADQAASLDWTAFAVHGVERVRSAGAPGDLRRTLEELFLPVAPTVRIYREGEEPGSRDVTGRGPERPELVAWQHRGVGLSSRSGSPYRSIRLNRPAPLARYQGIVRQDLEIQELRGGEIRLAASVRLLGRDTAAAGHLFLQVTGEGGVRFTDAMEDRPIRSDTWSEYVVEAPVADDATTLTFGAALAGLGRVQVRDLRLQVRRGDRWADLPVRDPSWETLGREDPDTAWITRSLGSAEHRFQEDEAGEDEGAVLTIALEEEPVAEPLFEARPSLGEATDGPLGRGLRARVPLALPGDGNGTPGGDSPEDLEALRAALEALDPDALDAADVDVRLAGVVVAWNVFQHFYPYFDVVETDWEAVLDETLAAALDDEGPEGFLGTLNRMLVELEDGHAQAFHALLRERRTLPLRLDRVEERLVVVASEDTARVRAGDVVLSLDGVPARELLRRAMARFSGSDRWRRHRALTHPFRGLASGEAGSEARLEVLRSGDTLAVTMVRDAEGSPEEPRPEDFTEVAEGVVYVNLDRASWSAIQEHVRELADARGLVFDLRGYPNRNHQVLSHLSDSTLQSAHWNVPRIIYPDRRGVVGWDTRGRWALEPREPRIAGEVVFLTDGRAISYAESVLGIVEAYELGEIVGRPTAGANGNVNPFRLPGGYTLSWTGMKVLKHDSTRHHLVGIRPTVPVERTVEAIRDGRDEYLETALELILGRERR